jgi:hypothetical protein
LRQDFCNDTIKLARIALESAIRDDRDLIALLHAATAPAKPARPAPIAAAAELAHA